MPKSWPHRPPDPKLSLRPKEVREIHPKGTIRRDELAQALGKPMVNAKVRVYER